MRPVARIQVSFCLAASLAFAASSSAQNALIPATLPEPAGGFSTGPVMPASLSVPARMLNGPRIATSEKQIRINIRYVMLDSETRKQIYQRLGTQRLKTVGGKVPSPQADFAGTDSADNRGTEFIAKSTHVTTCVLNADDMRQILTDVASAGDSKITRAPSIVLIDGQDTAITDLVQRPFVVDLQRQLTDEGPAVNSVVQVLSEGISIHLNAALTPSQRIHVVSDIVVEKVVDVQAEEVFGIGDEAINVQVPVHQRKTVRATENLQAGETLLVDPYVKHEERKTITTGIPILSSIPYISESFTNTESVSVQQQMILLIEPMIEAETAAPLPR